MRTSRMRIFTHSCGALALGTVLVVLAPAHISADGPPEAGTEETPAVVPPRDAALASFRRGAELLQNQQLEAALKEFNDGLALDPKNAEAHSLRGVIYRSLGDL